MAKTYENKQLPASSAIADTFERINDNSNAVDTDLNDLYGQVDSLVLGSANATIGAYPITAIGTDTYTGTFTDLTYFTGLFINLQGVTANTGAGTFNLNGLGAKDIKVRLLDGSLRDAQAGELHDEVQVLYDGTQFIVVDMSALESQRKIRNSFSGKPVDYYGNVKTADDGQDVSEWTSVLGTLSQDTSFFKIGNGSIRITEPDATVSNQQADKNNLTLDFTKLNNGELSDDDDYVYVVFYVLNAAAIDSNGIFISFSQGATFDAANRKRYQINSGIVTGWNYYKIPKSDFLTIGSGAWDGIQSLSYFWGSNAGFAGAYVSFQLIQLVKKDPLADYPNPFQRFNRRIHENTLGEIVVIEEFGVKKIIEFSEVGGAGFLDTTKKYRDFEYNLVLELKGGNTFCGLQEASGDQNIRVRTDADGFRLSVGGILIGEVPFIVNEGDVVNSTLIVSGTDVYATAYKNNDLTTLVQLTGTCLSIERTLGVYENANRNFALYSFGVSEIPYAARSGHADVADRLVEQPRIRAKSLSSQSIPTSSETTVVIDDVQLSNGIRIENSKMYVPENGFYTIKACVSFESNPTGYRYVSLRLNSSTTIALHRVSASTGGRTVLPLSTDYYLTKDDNVEVRVLQTSGSAIDVESNTYSPVLSAKL